MTFFSKKQERMSQEAGRKMWGRRRKLGETEKIRKDCRESKHENTLITATSQQ